MFNKTYMEAMKDIIKVQELAKEQIKNGDLKEAKKYLILSKQMLEALGRYGTLTGQEKVA